MENQIPAYFEERITACQTAVATLNGDSRTDEAVFEKIRMNVFTIFQQVYSASGRACGGDENKRLEFLRKQLEKIPSAWQAALETAQSHGADEKAHIEKIKLAAAEEIRQKITQWGEKK